jgi:beta-glucanase (GH16 family)
VLGLVFVAGAAVAAAASTLRTAPVPLGDPGSWHVVFDDEFNGSSLDTKKWSKGWFGTGVTQPLQPTSPACFDPRRVKVRNGSLNLSVSIKPETCGGKTRPYSAGIVTTDGKFSYTYGFAEIRAKLAVSSTGVVYDWLGGQLCWHFHSSAGSPGTCLSTPLKPGWHTFGADWEPGGVTYYYDGAAVGTIATGITSAPMYLIISFVADPQYSGPIRAASFRVAYVRVWQH